MKPGANVKIPDRIAERVPDCLSNTINNTESKHLYRHDPPAHISTYLLIMRTTN